MSGLAALFGFVLVCFGVSRKGETPAAGMRPYEVVIGALFVIVALVLDHLEKRLKEEKRRSGSIGRQQ